MISRHLICLALISIVFISQAPAQKINLTNDKDNQLITQAAQLENEVENILQKQEKFKNNPDSILNDSLSIIDITANDILNKLAEINELKLKYYQKASTTLDSSKLSTNKLTQLRKTILINGKSIFEQNSLKIKKELENENTDVQSVFNQIKANQELSFCALNISRDINDQKKSTLKYFSDPINIKNISELYKLNSDQITFLLTSAQDKNEKKDKSEKVVKGYSPFSDVYKEFIVFADSLSKNENANKKSKTKTSIKSTNNHPTSSNRASIINSISNDSIYKIAIKDSLFPSELISRFDKESLKRYWKIYQNQWSEPLIAGKQTDTIKSNYSINTDLASSESKNSETTINNKPDSGYNISSDLTQNEIIIKQNPDVPKDEVKNQKEEDVIPSATIVTNDNSKTRDNTIYYYVQIAASKSPMNSAFLKTIYNGKDSIITRQEEGWYKYQIGKTTDYSKAQKEVANLTVEGAFIAAYKHDEKQILWKTLNSTNYLQGEKRLIFAIQLSANKNIISTEKRAELQKTAGGFIRQIEEDGWYKYQYIVGSSYQEAILKWKEIGTDISFIVAYFDNEKIDISKAIQIYKRNKTN